MSIYRYFQVSASDRSRTNAYLCALLSYVIYEASPSAAYGQGFETRFKNLFGAMSASHPLHVEMFL